MVQLVTSQGRSLTPQLSLAGTGFRQGQQIGQNMANREALRAQQAKASQLSGFQRAAAGGDKQSLQQVAGLDPQAARQIQSLLANQSESERAEGLRENDVLTRTALDALSIEDSSERRLFLERKKNQFREEGRDTSNIDRALTLDDNGLNQAITMQARMGKSVADLASQAFPEALTVSQAQTIDIKNATLEIRKEENETRKLEQKLKREDNQLKREDLQLKIDERRQKTATAKRDIVRDIETGVSQIESTLDTIDRVRKHPGLESAVGIGSAFVFPTLPGSDAANFEAQIETLQSQQFLSAVGQMKGMGALSENEGKKLSSSIGALNLSMSDDAMKAELDRIFEVTDKARARMAGRLPKGEAKDTGITADEFRAMTPQQRAAALEQLGGNQ